MGKTLELPDDVWQRIVQEAKARNMEPAELVRASLEHWNKPDTNDLLRARGKTSSHPHARGVKPFSRIHTKDGSLLSEQIIRERI